MSDAIANTANVAEMSQPVVAEQPKVVAQKGTKSPKNATKVEGVAKRQPLGVDEVAKRDKVLLDDNKMQSSYTFKISGDATERYAITTVFDYSNCSRSELLELATASAQIIIQSKLRAMKDGALQPHCFNNVDVKRDIIEAQKTPIDDETRSIRALARAAGVSEEDARTILADLAAKAKRK